MRMGKAARSGPQPCFAAPGLPVRHRRRSAMGGVLSLVFLGCWIFQGRMTRGWRGLSMAASRTGPVYSRSGEVDVIARTETFLQGEHQFPICARFYRAVTRNSVQDVQTGYVYAFSAKPCSGSGRLSPALETQTYSVGNKKMLITRSEMRPPTMTMAKGRCESEQ